MSDKSLILTDRCCPDDYVEFYTVSDNELNIWCGNCYRNSGCSVDLDLESVLELKKFLNDNFPEGGQ